MKSFTNHTAGPRGVNLEGGATVWIDPGQTVEIDEVKIAGDVPDLGKPGDAAEQAELSLAELRAENEQLKARIADLEGGAPKPVSLTGKNKAALLDIAAAEGVDTFLADDGAAKPIGEGTNNDIIAAIEAKRDPAQS